MIEQAMTVQGRLAGRRNPAGDVAIFLGIPYAAPPVGDLRWRPPAPAAAWGGVRDAMAFAPIAIQPKLDPASVYAMVDQPQSEDCLYLNIWTAADTASERRPVIVWFHWGGFLFGSSSWVTQAREALLFDGSALARLGAVVVTVNYRLGRFGFLAHPWLSAEAESGCSGNYGIMDQVAALRWVRDNIESFGGDPDNVTLGGVSAGSASACLHMSSPLSKGLFHRAIGGSGAFMAPVSDNSGVFDRLLDLASAEQRGEAFAVAASAPDLAALRALPVQAVLETYVPGAAGPWFMATAGFPLGDGASDTCYPIVDGHAIPAPPADIFRAGRQNDVPLLTGSCLKDSSGLPAIDTLDAYRAYIADEYKARADECLACYPANDDASAHEASGDLLADRVFGWQNWSWARLAQRSGTQPVFYYDWTQTPPLDGARYVEKPHGAIHGTDILHIFDTLDCYDWPWSDADRALARVIARSWVSFARDGDPNGGGLPHWPALADDHAQVMRIASVPALAPLARAARFAFHDRLWALDLAY
jgi:para-nitrobenzyl esterase